MTNTVHPQKRLTPYGSFWHLTDLVRLSPEGDAFSCLERVTALEGEVVSRGPLGHVVRVTVNGCDYYVKIYTAGGKGLRRYFGRSRARAEWENLMFFRTLGVPVPEIVAFGQEMRFGAFRRGALITRAVPEADDMAQLANAKSARLQDRAWLRKVGGQIATYTRYLHGAGFVHVDLKWRNILVTREEEPKVYFFDCPSGGRQYGFRLKRGIIKDLACLDKVGRLRLPRTERLWFYKAYIGRQRLLPADKRMIRRILAFFEGRR